MRAGKRRAEERAYKEAYEEWFGSLPISERVRLRQLGLHKPKLDAHRISSSDEFDDPADRAIADEFVVEESDLARISETFAQCLIWAGQAKSLVEMGWRMSAMLHLLRPALIKGMALELRSEYARELVEAVGSDRKLFAHVGDYYRQVLAWILHRSTSLSQIGQRAFAAIYVINRAAIGGRTNAALGAMSNKTRQAFNRTVQDFRDSNAGYRNEVMRGELTRIKCRLAQISAC